MAGRVVVGVDGSPAGLQALRWAAAEARRRGVELCAVRAWCPATAWPGVAVEDWRPSIAARRPRASCARPSAPRWGAIPADLRVQAWAVEGPVAQTLIGYAHGHDDLLVVGASVRRWPRGDRVARTCLRRAPCPVVVVPAPALARAGRGRAVRRQLCREAEQFVQAHADVLS